MVYRLPSPGESPHFKKLDKNVESLVKEIKFPIRILEPIRKERKTLTTGDSPFKIEFLEIKKLKEKDKTLPLLEKLVENESSISSYFSYIIITPKEAFGMEKGELFKIESWPLHLRDQFKGLDISKLPFEFKELKSKEKEGEEEKKNKEKGSKEREVNPWYILGSIGGLILMFIGLWIPGAILTAFVGYKVYKKLKNKERD